MTWRYSHRCAALTMAFLLPIAPAAAWEYSLNPNSSHPAYMDDESYFRALTIDKANDVIACGSITFSEDPLAAFTVAKVSGLTGEGIWHSTLGLPVTSRQYNECLAVRVDENNDVLAAGFVTESYHSLRFALYKLSGSSGALLWKAILGGGDEMWSEATSIAVDRDNNIYAAGTVYSATARDAVLIKFSGADGAEIWRRNLSDTTADFELLNLVRAVDAGTVIVGGWNDHWNSLTGPQVNYVVRMISGTDGADIWREQHETTTDAFNCLAGLAQDAAQNIYISDGGTIVKLRNDGFLLWRQPFRNNYVFIPGNQAIGVDFAGDVFSPLLPGFRAEKRAGPTGEPLWNGGSNSDGSISSLDIDQEGSVIAVGAAIDSVGISQFAVSKLSGQDGTEVWHHSVVAPRGGGARAVAIDKDGNPVAAGSTHRLSDYYARADDSGVIVKLWGRTGGEYPPSIEEMFTYLAGELESLRLPGGITGSLEAKLANAPASAASPASDHSSAPNRLAAFLHEVDALRGKQISPGDADTLIRATEQIISILNE